VSFVSCDFCSGSPNPIWTPNLNEIYTEDPVFVRSVPNGKLYMGGTGDHEFYVAHVWGTPHEMGMAHGQLLKNELIDFFNKLWKHLEEDTVTKPDWVSQEVWDEIMYLGLDVALQLTEDATRPFTPDYWFEELQGLVDGVDDASFTFKDLYHISLLGELTKGACSMFGAWGDILADKTPGAVLQLRALDWDTGGPFAEYPAIIIYHPNSDNGHAFANVGWTGWIGSMTGMSSQKMAISEIGVSFPDDSFGEESRFGYPFTFVLRDLLQYDESVEESTARLAGTDRTCNLLFGVGDGKEGKFSGYQYSYSVLNVFDDKNLEPYNETWHQRIDNVVYWGMDWLCENFDIVLQDQLKQFYGNVTAENTIQYILPALQTGSTHIAVYDLANQYMYYSSLGLEGTPNRMAYQRAFTRLNMNKLFAEQQP